MSCHSVSNGHARQSALLAALSTTDFSVQDSPEKHRGFGRLTCVDGEDNWTCWGGSNHADRKGDGTRLLTSGQASAMEETEECPICGEWVLASALQEHVNKELESIERQEQRALVHREGRGTTGCEAGTEPRAPWRAHEICFSRTNFGSSHRRGGQQRDGAGQREASVVVGRRTVTAENPRETTRQAQGTLSCRETILLKSYAELVIHVEILRSGLEIALGSKACAVRFSSSGTTRS